MGGILQLAARMVGGAQSELSMQLNVQEGHRENSSLEVGKLARPLSFHE